jgi:hypothetical protein
MEIGGSMLSSLSLTGSDGIVRTSGNQVVRGVKNFVDRIITPLVYEPTGLLTVLAEGGDVNINALNNISISNGYGINTIDSVLGSNVLSVYSSTKIETTDILNTINNTTNVLSVSGVSKIETTSSTNTYTNAYNIMTATGYNVIEATGGSAYNSFDATTQNLFQIGGLNKLTIYSNQLISESPIYIGSKGLLSSISFANASQMSSAGTINLSIATSSLNSGSGQMIFPVPITIVYVVASSSSTANTAVQSLTFRMNDGATDFIVVSGIPAPLANNAQSIVYTPTAYDLPTNTAFYTTLTANVASATTKSWVITVFYIQRA